MVSLLDIYPKLKKRFKALKDNGVEIIDCNEKFDQRYGEFMNSLAYIANENRMEIVSCAENLDLTKYNIRPGKCIDDDYIERVFGINVTHKKDSISKKGMWLRGKQRYWRIQYMLIWLSILLCYRQL